VKPPPQLLEDTDLLAYVDVPDSATFTGKLHLFVDGERLGRVASLAICQQREDGSLLLVHCNEGWQVLGVQAWNGPGVVRIMNVEDMLSQAEGYYLGLEGHWVIAGRDA